MLWLLLTTLLHVQAPVQSIDTCFTGTFQSDIYRAKLRLLPDGSFLLDIRQAEKADVYHTYYHGTYQLGNSTLVLIPKTIGHSAENTEGTYEEQYYGADIALQLSPDGYLFEGDLELPPGVYKGSAFDLDCDG